MKSDVRSEKKQIASYVYKSLRDNPEQNKHFVIHVDNRKIQQITAEVRGVGLQTRSQF